MKPSKYWQFSFRFIKRSQASLEFLITYGIIILIIGLILAIIFSLGVFTPSSYATKPIISGFSGVTVSDAVANGSEFGLYLLNNLNEPVSIKNIEVITPSGIAFSGDDCTSNLIYPGFSATCYVDGSFGSAGSTANVGVNISYSIQQNYQVEESTGSVYLQVIEGAI